jgi:tetratricopeptide (TPR) repeat protein
MYRASRLFLIVPLLALATLVHAQGFNHATGAVSGVVRYLDGKPVRDAHVDLRNTVTGATVASGYTTTNGSYEFMAVPNGMYEVVVSAGLVQTSERVQVSSMDANVNLQLAAPEAADTGAGDRSTVSVAQMKVPEKARDAFKKAEKALAKHDIDEANKQCARALELFPKFPQALTLRGVLKLDGGQAEQALADLERAVEIDSGYAMGEIVLGATYNNLSRFNDAIRVLDRGVALAPASWQGYFELGRAYLGKSDFKAALRQLDKAAGLAPHDYAPLHLVRANLHLAQKNYPEAMNELEAYLQVDPQGAESAHARKVLDQVRSFTAGNK